MCEIFVDRIRQRFFAFHEPDAAKRFYFRQMVPCKKALGRIPEVTRRTAVKGDANQWPVKHRTFNKKCGVHGDDDIGVRERIGQQPHGLRVKLPAVLTGAHTRHSGRSEESVLIFYTLAHAGRQVKPRIRTHEHLGIPMCRDPSRLAHAPEPFNDAIFYRKPRFPGQRVDDEFFRGIAAERTDKLITRHDIFFLKVIVVLRNPDHSYPRRRIIAEDLRLPLDGIRMRQQNVGMHPQHGLGIQIIP